MHEASIAQSIMDMALRQLEDSGYTKIDSVSIKVGQASGILTDSLMFAFEAMKHGSPLAGAALLVEEVPVGGTCGACGKGFTTGEKFIFNCPRCGSPDIEVRQGRELDFVEMEVS
ncbi:MAG: hydrogenase maturation nickel metallochaperone HypA [Nitrospiraceae bacterium]|nr:hydrogenase maturation nickel metallochaperone HypA [Nitrospiraceae bacterium]